MPTELQNEFRDVGRGTDKPKGFVKLALLAMGTAIMGLSTTVWVLVKTNRSDAAQCALEQKQIMMDAQKKVDDIRVESNRKLEERLSRLENVEQKADSLTKRR